MANDHTDPALRSAIGDIAVVAGGEPDSLLLAITGLLLRMGIQRKIENGRCDLPISGHAVLLHRLGAVQASVAAFDGHLTHSEWRRIAKSI